MKCEEAKEYIWLEDEISETQLNSMKLHINECEECKKEYNAKKAFQNDVNNTDYAINIDNMSFKRRVIPKAIKKNAVSIAATIAIIFTIGFVSLSEPVFGYNFGVGLTNIINSFRNNFGRQFVSDKELVNTGEIFEIEGIKIDIRSLAYSKTDLSVFFTLEDTNNIYNGCTTSDIQFLVNGESCSYQGNQGLDYIDNISFGDFNIFLPDDKVPSEIKLKISDICIEENAFNKSLSYNVKKVNKENTRVIEGEWIIPIKLDKGLIEKADKHFAKYKLDYAFSNDDFSVKFNKLTVEASKSEIFHEFDMKNENSKKVVGFSDVEIYSEEGKCISKMTYKNGKHIYEDENNEIKEVTYSTNFPSSTIMLPFEDKKPDKIKILSYTTYEMLNGIDIDLQNVEGKIEQQTDFGNLTIVLDKVSEHRYLLDLSFKSNIITPVDMKLLFEGRELEYRDYSISGREQAESYIDGNFRGLNQSFEISSIKGEYKLEIWGKRNNETNIEIPIN